MYVHGYEYAITAEKVVYCNQTDVHAFLGALRSTAQMNSYEVSNGLIIITVILRVGSLNFSEIILTQNFLIFCLQKISSFETSVSIFLNKHLSFFILILWL